MWDGLRRRLLAIDEGTAATFAVLGMVLAFAALILGLTGVLGPFARVVVALLGLMLSCSLGVRYWMRTFGSGGE